MLLHVGMDAAQVMDGHESFADALLVGDDYGYIVFMDCIGKDGEEVGYENKFFRCGDIAPYFSAIYDAVTVEENGFIFCSIVHRDCDGLFL